MATTPSKLGKHMSANPVVRAGRGRTSAPEAAFDLWLQRGLRDMFDDVAKEPIPPELLALIEKDLKG